MCGILAIAIAFLGRAQASIFDSARAKLSDITAPALLEVRAPLAAIENWLQGLGTIVSIYRENLALKRENAELRRWQEVALSLENRVRRYEQLLNAVPEEVMPAITARVIGESNRPFVKTMILNAGNEHGVRKGQAVADDRGLIGRIYLTGERTSWVILLTDLSSRVPVVIESSQRRAILAGDNTPMPALDLDLAGGTATPESASAGDRVLSTGDGGLLPAGVPVGVVVKDGVALRVALFAGSAGDYVRILDYGVPPPPTTAESSAPASLGVKPAAPPQPASTGASTALPPKPGAPPATPPRSVSTVASTALPPRPAAPPATPPQQPASTVTSTTPPEPAARPAATQSEEAQ
jgi:rod shape-determining protein MreC